MVAASLSKRSISYTSAARLVSVTGSVSWICQFIPAEGFQYEPEPVDGALDAVDAEALVLTEIVVDALEEEEMVDVTNMEEEYAEGVEPEESVEVSSSSPVGVGLGEAVGEPVKTKLGENVAVIPVPDGKCREVATAVPL